jgi:leader peptidase (prepilin peptidase)/N-methyltransferase
MLYLLLFVLGANIGSFLNVCIWRLPRGESVSHPPSHCPHCNTRLRALDLIPLLSQFLLRGQCRYCGAKFSWRYFGIEFLTGALFVLAGMQPGMIGGFAGSVFTGDPVRLARDLIFMCCLVVIFWVDYDTKLIQIESVFLLALAGISYEFWQVWNRQANLETGFSMAGTTLIPFPLPLPGSLAALFVVAGVLWVLREFFSFLYKREAMGFGDVMLVGAIAANLGWNATLVTFAFLSVVVGALLMILMQLPRAIRAFRWAKARERRYGSTPAPPAALLRHAFRKGLPFGPMLAGGAVVALLYGVQLNAAYLNLWQPA